MQEEVAWQVGLWEGVAAACAWILSSIFKSPLYFFILGPVPTKAGISPRGPTRMPIQK